MNGPQRSISTTPIPNRCEFFTAERAYWIEEFHFDGYRYDATHAIQDASQEHILAAVNRTARQAAGERSVYLVAENAVGEARTVWPAREGGFDMDAVWNDDFHHAARASYRQQCRLLFRLHRFTRRVGRCTEAWIYLSGSMGRLDPSCAAARRPRDYPPRHL